MPVTPVLWRLKQKTYLKLKVSLAFLNSETVLNQNSRTGKMAHLLRALDALAEDPCLVPNTPTLTWTNGSFFNVRILRSGEDKEEKSWGQEVLHKLCLMLGKIIKKYSIMYVVFRRETRQCQ